MTGPASDPDGAAVSATLEAELNWSAIKAGRCFPQVAFALDDASVDAYLQATGEADPHYEPAAGFVPPLYTTLVRFVKASLGGRWPSGTVQLGYRIAMRPRAAPRRASDFGRPDRTRRGPGRAPYLRNRVVRAGL